MKTYLCIVAAAVAAAFGWLLESARYEGRHCTNPAPEPEGPLPPLPGLYAVTWFECPSTECAHLEAPHRRVAVDMFACCWCFRLTEVPAGVRRG